MSMFKITTEYPYDLFDLWNNEIKNKAVKMSEQEDSAYLVFLYDTYTSYIYFLKYINDESNIINCINEIPDQDMCPIHCNPAIDMSDYSILDLVDDASRETLSHLSYAELDIEQITIKDIADSVDNLFLENKGKDSKICTSDTKHSDDYALYVQPTYDHIDPDISDLCKFLNLASPGSNTMPLKSFISQILIDKNYDNTLFEEDISPQRHTEIELRSELMKCNLDLYVIYKTAKTDQILSSIVNDSRSKSEIEHGLSGLAYEMLCDHVVYCTNSLWCFVDNIWKEYSSDGCIWNFLTSQFISYLTINDADKIAMHIKSVNIRSRILKDIKLRLQDDFFYMLLDSRTNVIHMRNGIYNIDTMQLSKPVPSDYISVTSGVSYQVFDETSAKMTQLLYILSSIFPNSEILDFFILSCSTFLEGHNSQKVFYVWWGTGNNAKTLVQTLVMKAFGEYCSTAPTSLVTGRRADSANATPELCHVEKKLVVFLQEPNPDEKIKAGRMKEMTGNDRMYVRQLFKSGRTITLKAKFVIVCNNILEIPGMDAAIRRRMVVIPFMSTFLDSGEYYSRKKRGTLDPYSNIIDPSIESSLMECKQAFMYLLSKRYYEWTNTHETDKSLNVPTVIKQISSDYITRNNYPLKFIQNFLHYAVGSVVQTSEIYELFKDWFRKSYPGKKVPDFEKFAKELSEEGYQDNEYNLIEDIFVSYRGQTHVAEN